MAAITSDQEFGLGRIDRTGPVILPMKRNPKKAHIVNGSHSFFSNSVCFEETGKHCTTSQRSHKI